MGAINLINITFNNFDFQNRKRTSEANLYFDSFIYINTFNNIFVQNCTFLFNVKSF